MLAKSEYQNITYQTLQDFVTAVFVKAGFSTEVAQKAAAVLVMADLRGIESHGVGRLHGYIRQVDEAIIKTQFTPHVERESHTTAILNGDEGLGLFNGGYAAEIAYSKAKEHGSGWVAIKNSSHFGIAIAHVRKALDQGMIVMAMTNASPLVSPAGGKERLLGTNPICIGIPAGKNQPFILDMATTVVANGKLEVAKRKGEAIPVGYAQTDKGQSTTSPDALKEGGSMLPLGSSLQHSSYKGYGLGSWVDIFSGVLSGANFGPWVPPFVPFLGHDVGRVGEGIGHFIGCWSADAFMELDAFKNRMDQWIDRFKNSQAVDGVKEVLVPGMPEYRNEQERLKNGIPIHHSVVENLESLAIRFQLKIDWQS